MTQFPVGSGPQFEPGALPSDQQIDEAMSKLYEGISSAFPGKKIEDLTSLTKWSVAQIREAVDKGDKKALAELKKLTHLDRDQLHGIVKNYDTMQEVIKNIKTALLKDRSQLLTFLKADDKLKAFFEGHVHKALDVRYASWTKKVKGGVAKKEFSKRLEDQNTRVFAAMKAPLSALFEKKKAKNGGEAQRQQFQEKLPPLAIPAKEIKPAAAPTTPQSESPKTPATPPGGASLKAAYEKYGFTTSPTHPSPSPASAASIAEQYAKYGFATAPAAPQAAPIKKEPSDEAIRRDMRAYGRAYLTVVDSMKALSDAKFGMVKESDRLAIDAKVKEAEAQKEKLTRELFQDVHTPATLDRFDDEVQGQYSKLEKDYAAAKTEEARGTIRDQMELCDFCLRAIKVRRDGL